jgi:YVTN family beta-propeller protein
VAFGVDSSEIWVLTSAKVYQLDWNSNRTLSEADLGGAAGIQAIRYHYPSRTAFVGATIKGKVQLTSIAQGKVKVLTDGLGRTRSGALALCAKKNLAIVPLLDENQIALVDLSTGKVQRTVDVGVVPFGAVVDAEGTVAYISNWGGRRPGANDLIGLMGYRANPGRVVVDNRGIASTGTITKVDLEAGTISATIVTGLHPTAMALDEKNARLYVANGNEDSVSVIDTHTDRVTKTLAIKPFRENAFGAAPTALALTRDGSALYVACGGLNAIAVFKTDTGALTGMIPTAWYPAGLALSPDGKNIAVSTLLGEGAGYSGNPKLKFALAVRGSIAVIPVPDAAQLASYTTAVAENNHVTLGPPGTVAAGNPSTKPVAIPNRSGEPSLIEHVVFIIKENRTYDQVLGDIGKGNSEPSLAMFGRDVTPNQHKLAEQFVLLDNFYAVGGNSADGHQWLTQANETDYCLWAGYQGRSYPFDGSDPIAYSNPGFLWDAALRMKKTVRIYGEYAGLTGGWDRQKMFKQWRDGEDFHDTFHTVAPLAPLNAILAANYPAYSTAVPDVVRSKLFLADIARWQQAGEQMPNLTMIALPSNHTAGTRPDESTPKSMVADNDLAVGQIVEALTKSRFWPKMLIFVVEDDAQNGVDHVDGHRTVALAISPYIRRGTIDSSFYSQLSMLKTIELVLGLPSLTLFDLIAPSMNASFTNVPDLTTYAREEPKQSLFEVNPPLKSMRGQERRDAVASRGMRFDIPDAAPTEKLNRIIWRSVRGVNANYPQVRHSIFAPLAVDVDDDDR